VLISLIVSGFPFAFLLTLSYVTGIDPTLASAAATLGASPWQQFRRIYLPLLMPGLTMAACLSFVQAFSVFPSAVLLGAPAGPTRVMSIAAAEAAFESYDYSLASAIAMVMVMGFVQLLCRGHARRTPLLPQRPGNGRQRLMTTDHRAAQPGWSTSGSKDHDDGAGEPGKGVKRVRQRASVPGRVWRVLVWGAMVFFLVNVVLLIATVAVNSVATRWFGTLLPQGFTLHWYGQAWSDFQLASVLWVTVEVVGAVVLLSVLLGVPAAYALARVLVPGMLAAGLLVLVRTIGMFELTFFTAGPATQTLVVALYYDAVFSTGVRAPQSIDAMAMIYMAITLIRVLIALQFVSPTQIVSRVKEQKR
jgi:ABC-type spermidine/putrescine transport system permease subunit II